MMVAALEGSRKDDRVSVTEQNSQAGVQICLLATSEHPQITQAPAWAHPAEQDLRASASTRPGSSASSKEDASASIKYAQYKFQQLETSLHPVDSSETGSFSLASSKPTCKSETSTLPFAGCKLPRMKRLTFSRVSLPASFTPISCQDRRLTLYTRMKQQVPVTKAHQQATFHGTW